MVQLSEGLALLAVAVVVVGWGCSVTGQTVVPMAMTEVTTSNGQSVTVGPHDETVSVVVV